MEIPIYHPFRSEKAQKQYLEMYDKKAQEMWPVNSESRMVETSYGQTFVRISGPNDAPPLILLPGSMGTSLLWMHSIKAFSACYKTYAVDNIYDFGRSVYTRPITKPEDFVNWLNELFTSLGLGNNINLIGLSFGGWLTCQYALHFQHRLNKIVLLSPAATVLPLELKFLIRAIFFTIIPLDFIAKNYCNWIFEDLARKDDASRKIVESAIDELLLGLRCFKPKRMISPTVLQDNELQSIKVPTLYLVGENEKIYSAQKAIERLNNVAPHIRTNVIPNAGHDLWIAQANIVNSKVLEFLK